MTRKTYKAREREVGKIAEGVAKETCKVMFDKECELVKKNGGTILIHVYASKFQNAWIT